ncbi:HAD family hydrolase [Microbacterium arabinogalactanolyticum]|uniref:HAD family hydrolase n=1 Tax=Microbacterium arabinogalactanolyticum TaxID=69365 RepID=UPI0040441F71
MTESIRAVFFDLDDTLVGDGAVDAALLAIGELAARHPDLDTDAMRTANATVWSGCWASQGEQWMRGELEDDALTREVWRRTLSGAGAGGELVDEAVELHLEAERRTFALFEDSRDVLVELRRRGIPIGLITNGPSAFQREKLRTVGIDGLFDVVVASGDIGVLKPDAEIFRHALDRAGVLPAASLHVGDSFTADVMGAVGAGLSAFWLNRERIAAPPNGPRHVEGDSLRAVLELVG